MQVELRDSLENLYPDAVLDAAVRQPLSLDVARGGTISVHVLAAGLTPGHRLRLALRETGRTVPGVRWFRLLDVPVEANTGLLGFTDRDMESLQYPNAPNPHVVRQAPFRTYDAMEPVGAALTVAMPTTALRLQLAVPADARPGLRQFTVRLSDQAASAECALTVNVRAALIPAAGIDTLPYTNWFSYEVIAQRHGLTQWSEPYWRMLRRYAEMMHHARQNTFWIPLKAVFTLEEGRPVLNRARLRRIVKLFTACGLNYIEGGHLADRTGNDATTYNLTLGGAPATAPAAHTTLVAICRQLMVEIEANGWRARWLQHVADEPQSANAVDYRILVGMTRKYMPGITILDAMLDPDLVGSVDIYCPWGSRYQENREKFEARRALGDRVWHYTACFPGGPWLNRLLDQELLRPALLGWASALFRLDGFLHWGLNHYREDQDPFQQGILPNFGGGPNSLPAGDTHIVYPGTDGPWSSLRLEAQREGVEDYELLRQLQARDPARADRVTRQAVRGFDDYVRDVDSFRRARRALLNTLEKT